MSEVRLHKYIAECGITSRRKAEALILAGRVLVGGKRIETLGFKVNPSTQLIQVDGEILSKNSIEKIYLVLHKPRGFVTTLSDPEGRNTVMDLCREINERIYPVGRLDYLSEGLLILTNDGEFAHQVIHPTNKYTRIYEVKIPRIIDEKSLIKLRGGVIQRGSVLKPLSVRIVKRLPKKTWLEFRLGEGKNREIRRICERHGFLIDKLRRVAIGGLTIKGIPPGQFFSFTKKQLLKEIEREYLPLGRK